MGFSESFRKQVMEVKGTGCAKKGCEKDPGKNPSKGNKITIHPINGDDGDERLENALPVCQSHHIKIHRHDEPPYQFWHRQLSREARSRMNQYDDKTYDGEQCTWEEALASLPDDHNPRNEWEWDW